MQWIENIQYFLNVILPESIIKTLSLINALMSPTVAWILLLLLLVFSGVIYTLLTRLSLANHHEYELDEILLLNSKCTSTNELNQNFIDFGLWLSGEYIALYQLQGETYVLLISNIDLNNEKSLAAASLHISKREVKLLQSSGNFKISFYISSNEKYLLSVYARQQIDMKRYEGVMESLFSYYHLLKEDDENIVELQLAKTSRLLFDTINGTRFGDDGYLRYLLSMVKKVVHADYIKLFHKDDLRLELGQCSECINKIFYIRNTNYKVEVGTQEDIDIQSLTTVGSFLDLTGVFMSTLSEEGVIARNYIDFLEKANALLETEDEFLTSHSEKVSIVSTEIGKVLFLTVQELEALEHAAKLHDIGSITDLDDLIEENHDESENYKLHPLIGSILLEPVVNIFPIASIVKYHHERYDGNGYPFGIKGNAIPQLAQILALAEYYIGLVSHRSFKLPYTHEEAVVLVENSSDKMFEKIIVDSFLSIHDKVNKKLIQFENKLDLKIE